MITQVLNQKKQEFNTAFHEFLNGDRNSILTMYRIAADYYKLEEGEEISAEEVISTFTFLLNQSQPTQEQIDRAYLVHNFSEQLYKGKGEEAHTLVNLYHAYINANQLIGTPPVKSINDIALALKTKMIINHPVPTIPNYPEGYEELEYLVYTYKGFIKEHYKDQSNDYYIKEKFKKCEDLYTAVLKYEDVDILGDRFRALQRNVENKTELRILNQISAVVKFTDEFRQGNLSQKEYQTLIKELCNLAEMSVRVGNVLDAEKARLIKTHKVNPNYTLDNTGNTVYRKPYDRLQSIDKILNALEKPISQSADVKNYPQDFKQHLDTTFTQEYATTSKHSGSLNQRFWIGIYRILQTFGFCKDVNITMNHGPDTFFGKSKIGANLERLNKDLNIAPSLKVG